MTGLFQDHRDRLTLVSKPRAQTSPPPPCGGTSEFAMQQKFTQNCATWLSLGGGCGGGGCGGGGAVTTQCLSITPHACGGGVVVCGGVWWCVVVCGGLWCVVVVVVVRT